MQPPRPASYRAGFLDRLIAGRKVDEASRMIVRNLERFPARAAFTALGLGASLSLLIGTQFVFASLDHVVDRTYYQSQRWNLALGFASGRDIRAVEEVRRLPAVIAAEAIRIVPATISARGREQRVRVTGLDPDATLHRPLDGNGDAVPLLKHGAVLSEALARKLEVGAGGTVRLEFNEGSQPSTLLPVTGLTQDFSGFAVYLERGQLNRILGEGDAANGAEVLVEPDRRAAFYRAIDAIPQIIAAASRDDTVQQWRTAMTEAFRLTIGLQVTFAAAIAFGVAYNTSRITLSERSRDLATLRVLGFERRECAYILLGELLILTLVALVLGILGGNLLSRGLVAAFSRDEMRLPLIMTPRTYAVSFSAFLTAVLLAASLVARRIWTLDLVAVLKTRE
jgi:putative ABC transport system permease protein